MSKYSILPIVLLTALYVGCSADDDVNPDDGCREMNVEEAFTDRPDDDNYTGSLWAARLRDGCLELAHTCCACTEVNATATRSPLAVYPPIYVVSVEVRDDPKVNCYWVGRDSTRFSLAGIRALDGEFDLTFEGLDGTVIEVR